MSDELTKYGGANNLPAIKQLEHFQMLLNKEPDQAHIKKHTRLKAEGNIYQSGLSKTY